jgi:hypothetical protein
MALKVHLENSGGGGNQVQITVNFSHISWVVYINILSTVNICKLHELSISLHCIHVRWSSRDSHVFFHPPLGTWPTWCAAGGAKHPEHRAWSMFVYHQELLDPSSTPRSSFLRGDEVLLDGDDGPFFGKGELKWPSFSRVPRDITWGCASHVVNIIPPAMYRISPVMPTYNMGLYGLQVGCTSKHWTPEAQTSLIGC